MSKRIVGDTWSVAATGQWANRAIAAALMLAVGVVGVLALWPWLNGGGRETAVLDAETDLAGAERAYPGREILIEDNEFPLTVSCVRASGSEQVFVVIITNGGAVSADYLVAAELSSEAGETVEALAEINDLRSGEKRETVLVPDTAIGDVAACAITAVQGDRRVLLSR